MERYFKAGQKDGYSLVSQKIEKNETLDTFVVIALRVTISLR
jgi:hypothetical protein